MIRASLADGPNPESLVQERPLSVLDGIPVAFKDNFSVKGVPMTCASVMLAEYVAPYDATVARKLVHEAGCVMMGKTNMDEFAIGSGCLDSAFGPCLNPWRSGLRFAHRPDVLTSESRLVSDSHVPGGSSGGSAVAVATG